MHASSSCGQPPRRGDAPSRATTSRISSTARTTASSRPSPSSRESWALHLLSQTVILILGFANLLADGFSMGASNYLARRSNVESDASDDRTDALRHGAATIVGFVIAGTIPLVAYLAPIGDDARLPTAVGLTAGALFGASAHPDRS